VSCEKISEYSRSCHCDGCNIKKDILSHIPKKYHHIDTDKNEILEENYGNSLFIWGDAGTGKTVFLASLAKKYICERKSIMWRSFPAMIFELQSCFSKEENFDKAVKKIALFDGFLFLDDVGAEKLTEWVRQTMYYIINEREQRCLQTVITSNFSLSKIDEQIDSRISSRIAGMCKVIKFTGKDRRIAEGVTKK
jgi:DNA replication protein DnaC